MQYVDTKEEVILSDGENLSLASWDRLNELHQNANRLAGKLGRTDHYARKNRSAIERIHDDIEKVDREIRRRWALTTISFCGLTFYCQGVKEVHAGRYDSLKDVPADRRKDAIEITDSRICIWVEGKLTPVGQEKKHWAIREKLVTLVRQPSANLYSAANPQPETIHVTIHELKEYVSRGAIKTESPDPCAPWKIAEEQD